MTNHAFQPDWAVHPGETLRELLQERRWSQLKLATALGLSPAFVSDVINGKRPVGVPLALRLEAAFGGPPATLWLNLQRDHDLFHARRKMAAELEEIRREAGRS